MRYRKHCAETIVIRPNPPWNGRNYEYEMTETTKKKIKLKRKMIKTPLEWIKLSFSVIADVAVKKHNKGKTYGQTGGHGLL